MPDAPWVDRYPARVPAQVDTQAYRSLLDLLETSCHRFAERPALRQQGTVLGYRELDRLSRHFAAWLQHRAGLQPGERLAIMLPNLLQYPVALIGAWRAGLVVVNVNPLYTAHELAHQLSDAGATALLTLQEQLPLARQVRAQAGVALRQVIVTATGELGPLGISQSGVSVPLESDEHALAEAWAEASLPAAVALPADHETLALLQYTGGTTGVSKGAMLSHGNLVANVLQAAAWYGSELVPGEEVAVTVLPLYHIFAHSFCGLLMMHFGAENRLVTNPRDLPGLLNALSGSSVMAGVNTLYNGLLHAPGIQAVDFSRLKISVSGGAATLPSVVEGWQRLTGNRIIEGYGLTETSPFALCNTVTERFGGGLLPMPSTEVAICNDQGAELPSGEVGEICIRGPQVMRGYWQRPDETAAVLSPEGWLRTGDVGSMNVQGRLQITDRKKDLVLVSGFNVYPNEVEAVIAQHPGVLESAVVGVPDERTGEALRAFVVRRDDTLSEAALIEHCRHSLTAYKVPRQVVFMPQLPKTAVGKILRRELRA